MPRRSRSTLGSRRRQKEPPRTFPLIGPGFKGLNTELQTLAGIVDPLWALRFDNGVFDKQGRVATRNGYVSQTTTTAATSHFVQLFEYVLDDGTTQLIGQGQAGTFWRSTDDGDTWSNITGTISTTSEEWVFVNFQDDVFATAPGHKVWQYDTTLGVFTQIASSPVTNGVLLAAFGRLWAGTDAVDQIKYSALLDGTTWSGTGTGTLDLSNAWTRGNDVIVGIYAFGATFVVFGRKHILLYVDGSGSVLGIDPDNMYVVDTIEGTGLKYRDSVISIGEGDLWFHSKSGIQSLQRVVQDKSNPLVSVSDNVRSLVLDLSDAEVGTNGSGVKAVYSEKEQLALFLYPESNKIVFFDTRFPLEDGTYRSGQWLGMNFESLLVRDNDDILFAYDDSGLKAGQVAKYTGYRDDGATIFDMTFATPWMDFGPDAHNRLKIIKYFYGLFYGRETLSATARWAVDFRPQEFVETFTNDFESSGAEFGVGEYSQDEFGTGLRLRRQYVAGQGEGQFVQFQVAIQSLDVDDVVAIQEIGMAARLGRLV